MCRFKDNSVLFYLLLFSCLVTSYTTPPILSEKDIIKLVIEKQSARELQLSSRKRKYELSKQESISNFTVQPEVIPEFFDARNKWPKCKSLHKVRNHKMCGAGWAFAAAATMSDRLCIQSDGQLNVELSPQELISCCADCGGCGTGNSLKAWQFWVDKGLVTGGDYDGSVEGCKPYLESTAHYREIPVCNEGCADNYNTSYQEDKYFGKDFYTIKKNVSQTQIDIMTNGPVQAGLEVYEDFFKYKRGVYRHNAASKHVGYTHVKLLGWGVQRNVPYWLAVTTWGSEFGGLSGFFKILRGKNEAGIEANVVAGQAQIVRSPSSTTSATSFPVCFYSIRSISIMMRVSWGAFIVTIGSIFFSLFSMTKKRVNFYQRPS